MSKVEAAISSLEKEIKKWDVELSINYEETIAKPTFFNEYQSLKDKLSNLMEEWESLTLQIESTRV